MYAENCTFCGITTPDLKTHQDIAHKKEIEAKDAQATNKVLLFFEEIPDSTKLYLLQVTDNELNKLQECHDTLSDSTEDENYLWLKDFLDDKVPLYMAGESVAPVLNAVDNLTVICTGSYITQDSSEDEEDFSGDEDESEEETFELSTDPKTYYFHATCDEDEEEASEKAFVVITPKECFDNNISLNEFVSDTLDLGDKFAEIEEGFFVFDGNVNEAVAELTTKGMTLNSKL